MNIAITGIGLISGLGNDAAQHENAVCAGQSALRPLAGLLGNTHPFADVHGAWIEPRDMLNSRKWAPASMLSLLVAKQAVADAQLTSSDLADAAIIVGSSRGNLAGWAEPWPSRRSLKLMAASNSMHGELASAISIELGVHGPWHLVSSGCAASLDAIGMARMMLLQGVVQKAIVVGVELPLLPSVLSAYRDTGVLAKTNINDPYSDQADGLCPAEAGAAIVLEATDDPSHPSLTGYWCNSDAATPVGMPADGRGLSQCLEKATNDLKNEPEIAAVCPHASGTMLHGKAELAAMSRHLAPSVSMHPLKPFTGHTVGASGVLDCAVLTHFMRRGQLPPNLPGLTNPDPYSLDVHSLSSNGATVLKIAVGMGGHNSIVSLRSPAS